MNEQQEVIAEHQALAHILDHLQWSEKQTVVLPLCSDQVVKLVNAASDPHQPVIVPVTRQLRRKGWTVRMGI